jgi:hypothetical protein
VAEDRFTDFAGLQVDRTPIARTLLQLEGTDRRTVRILFYGQSITEQGWTKIVAERLRQRYPNVELLIENRAIGGHSSQLLCKTAEADLYPFYPDLLIFHVYGDHTRYEQIIEQVRMRTTAEILLQTDHMNADQRLDEPTDPADLGMDQWVPWFNYAFLPEVARKYHACLVDQRNAWKRYLTREKIEPSVLLTDQVHLNDRGCEVMAAIVDHYLRPIEASERPALVAAAVADQRITVTPVDWDGERATVEGNGNRIDLVADGGATGVTLDVLIDGIKPSAHPSCYRFSRVSGYRGSNWPCLLRVQRGPTPLVIETWTMEVFDASDDYRSFKFRLHGSTTGADGEGSSDASFQSRSGRIAIEPEDWNLVYCRQVYGQPLEPGAAITFAVEPQFLDRIALPPTDDASGPATIALATGLENGAHRVELSGSAAGRSLQVRWFHPSSP